MSNNARASHRDRGIGKMPWRDNVPTRVVKIVDMVKVLKSAQPDHRRPEWQIRCMGTCRAACHETSRAMTMCHIGPMHMTRQDHPGRLSALHDPPDPARNG